MTSAVVAQLCSAQEVQQRPGRTTGLKEHIVDLGPGSAHLYFRRCPGGLGGGVLPGQVGIDTPLADAGTEALGQAAQAGVHGG